MAGVAFILLLLAILLLLSLRTERDVCIDLHVVRTHFIVGWYLTVVVVAVYQVPTNNILCSTAAGSESLDELISSVTQRLGTVGEKDPIQLLVSFPKLLIGI